MSFTSDNALIVNGNFGVDFLEEIIADILAFVAARFVAEAPHGNAGVVLIPFIHSFDPIKIMVSPFNVIAESVGVICAVRHGVKAVGFNIRFINGIKPVNVAHGQKYGVGRIVRGSDGVAVVFFHKAYIVFQIVKRHCIALCHMRIVMIYAQHFYRLAVKQKYFAVYSDILEAYISADCFANPAAVFDCNNNFINIRRFGSPFVDL